MPENVQFTKSSARRIGSAVRSVEGRPFPDNKLQRRRAGGLGRSTLWEVTAIQTGPETVTIQRVENQAGDLIVASEKTDILYDPDNEPSVGDRGLLIRLGSGSLFFFSKPPVANKAFLTEYCYVKQDTPDTNYGYPNTAQAYEKRGSGEMEIAVFKFDVRPSGGPTRAKLILGETSGTVVYSPDPFQTGFADGRHRLYRINEDFDPSTLTWNILMGLSHTILTTAPLFRLFSQGGSKDGDDNTDVSGPPYLIGVTSDVMDEIRGIITTSAYGIAIYSLLWFPNNPSGGSIRTNFTYNEDMKPSWIEWE